LLASSAIGDGMHVLDLGCGTGTLAVMVKRAHPSTELVGLDADAEILSTAHNKAKAAGQSIGLIRGLSTALPYQNACFDRVLSTLFFHHLDLDQKTRTVAEIYRVLKPGGRLLVADWGKPTGWIMRVLFYAIQIFDGFSNTRDNVDGRLPELFAAVGFDVAISAEINTMFGTLALYSASTPRDDFDSRVVQKM
jgi:ubiquinone/menaquinone biosynthesis C-methylase UbiE